MNAPVLARKQHNLVGEIIDRDLALDVIKAYKEKFPGEISKLLIKTKTIFDCVKNLQNVSGIRFMWGLKSANDPQSKVLILIPCNNTSAHQLIPNSIIKPEGYITHEGENISLKKTWEFLYNHAVHLSKYNKGIRFHKIVRGNFWGIDSLKSLLLKTTDSDGAYYHFTYNEAVSKTQSPYNVVLEPVDKKTQSFNSYFDISSLCPPFCGPLDGSGDGAPSSPSCALTSIITENSQNAEKELNVFRDYRDNYFLTNPETGFLVEMYYYISPALIEAIEETGKSKEIYQGIYDTQIKTFNYLLQELKYEEAKVLFESTIDELMQIYLFKRP